jgi:hypothetical protein
MPEDKLVFDGETWVPEGKAVPDPLGAMKNAAKNYPEIVREIHKRVAAAATTAAAPTPAEARIIELLEMIASDSDESARALRRIADTVEAMEIRSRGSR